MKGISHNEMFGERELELFQAATSLVELLPEKDYAGELLRCHEVARVVGHVLDLEVLDGRFEYGCEHSWRVIAQVKYRGFTILDPYAIGRIPPMQMLCIIPTIPNRYFPEARRRDIRLDVVDWLLEHLGAKNGYTERDFSLQVPVRREEDATT